jgi:diguanylate cyclase
MRTPQTIPFPSRSRAPRRGAAPVAATHDDGRSGELRFVRRVHRMRTLGLALGCLCIASVLRLHDASVWWWLLLFANGFAWPHVAWWLASRSMHPREKELRNLIADSALGGVWVAVMQFNLLPSALVVTMLAVDKVSVGGPPLLTRTFMVQAVACAFAWALLGFPLDVATPTWVMVACLPFLTVYPVAISGVTFALASRVAQQNRRLEEMGRTDDLTGLANRRKAFVVAEAELARHRRTGRPVALLMLDIDRFKLINDRFGHPAGDEVLRSVAEVLRKCCRATDTPARYGGDEFIVVLPETDLRGAEEVAHRIRNELNVLVVSGDAELRCAVSVGAAEASLDVADVEVWVQRADEALYLAKDADRDRLVPLRARLEPVAAAGD